jgi:hypothetical protein
MGRRAEGRGGGPRRHLLRTAGGFARPNLIAQQWESNQQKLDAQEQRGSQSEE